jgi:hypothetical protein
VWRFRLVAFVLLAVIGGGTAWGINQVMHLGDQDPTPVPAEQQNDPAVVPGPTLLPS